MIAEIIKLLPQTEYGQNEIIDFAKGKKELPTTYKKLIRWLKRK